MDKKKRKRKKKDRLDLERPDDDLKEVMDRHSQIMELMKIGKKGFLKHGMR